MNKEILFSISGLYLMFDGFVSMLVFPNQPFFYHIPRLVRMAVGILVFIYAGEFSGKI